MDKNATKLIPFCYMKNVMFYLFLMLGMLLTSCAAKKNSTTEIVETSSDTLTYVLPSENRLVIESLCDSLGNPIQFVKEIDTGVSDTKVEVKDNQLVVEVRTDTVYKDRIVYRDREVKVDKEVVRYKIPAWVWLSYAGIILVAGAYLRFKKLF